MKFEPFQITEHDVQKISEMVYESNREILQYAFGKKKKNAQKRIARLIKIGKNHYGYENVYIAFDENKIAGFFFGYTGKEQNYRLKNTNSFTFLKLMLTYGYIKYKLFIRPLFMKISLVDIKEDDFYISNIIVGENYSDKDVDIFLFENAKKVAISKNCKNIVTDSSLDNYKSKEFNEKHGFEIYDKKEAVVKSEKIGNYFMRYRL